MKKRLLWVASAIAAIIIYHICYNLATLLPSNISWLMTARHDWGTHYLGWAFYKDEPWHFPLGQVSGYYYPVGTNVGFTDSIPLLAIFFKLFAPILPSDFQYFGIWLLLCNLLTAWFTILFLRRFKVNDIIIFIAVIFMVANPVLVYRGLHPALCAQWMFIASAYVYFLDPKLNTPKKILLYQFLLLTISSVVNPYICFMVAGFTVALIVRVFFFDKSVNWIQALAWLAGSFLSIGVLWYLIGMVTFQKSEDLGVAGAYGLYSLNLNALYDPSGFSSFLHPQKQVSWHQYEGFMYLGMGMFMLLLVLLVYGIYTRVTKKYDTGTIATKRNISLAPLITLLILVTLFAITHVVTLNDKVLFKFPLPDNLVALGDIFRASARFFWIPYYVGLLAIIVAVSRMKIKPAVIMGILAAALLVQLYDIKRLLTFRHPTYGTYNPPLDKERWITLMKQFDEVAFYPPFEANQLHPMDYQDFSYLAMKAGKPINLGYVARADNKKTQTYRDSLTNMIENAQISPKTLYITTAAHLNHFSLLCQLKTGRLNALDGYYYVYAPDANTTVDTLSAAANERNKPMLDSAVHQLSNNSFTETTRLPLSPGTPIKYFIERINNAEKYISVNGWAFIDSSQNNKGDSVFFVLSNDHKFYKGNTVIQSRPDITAHFNKTYMDDAGFATLLFKDSVEKGIYKLGIVIKDKQGHYAYQETGNDVKAGISEYATPVLLTDVPPEGNLLHNVDEFKLGADKIVISGWAAIEKQDADGSTIAVVLKNGNKYYMVATDHVPRPDVTAALKSFKFDEAGFRVSVLKSALDKGHYQVGILVTDKNGKRVFKIADKQFDIN